MSNKIVKKISCFLMSFLLIILGTFTSVPTKIFAMKPVAYKSEKNIQISDVVRMVNECTSITAAEKKKIIEALNYIQIHFRPITNTQFKDRLTDENELFLQKIQNIRNHTEEQNTRLINAEQSDGYEYVDISVNDMNGSIMLDVAGSRNADIGKRRNDINRRIDDLRDFTDNAIPELVEIIERNVALNREEKDRLQQALSTAQDEICRLEIEFRGRTVCECIRTRNFRYGLGFGAVATMFVMTIVAMVVAICMK